MELLENMYSKGTLDSMNRNINKEHPLDMENSNEKNGLMQSARNKEHPLDMENSHEKNGLMQSARNVRNWIIKKYRRRHELLKTSLTFQTRQFFENTTLHGVRYINEPNRPFFEKFMWFVFTSIGAVATIVVIVALWEKFQNNPTLTGLDTDYHTWDVKFPAITLCLDNPIDSKKVDAYRLKMWGDNKRVSIYRSMLIDVANISNYNLHKFKKYNEKINFTVTDLRELQANLVKKCDALFKSCIYKGKPFNCCDRIVPFPTEIGFCYAFNSRHAHTLDNGTVTDDFKDEQIDETDANWVLQLHIPKYDNGKLSIVRVYVHSAEEIPIVELYPLYTWSHEVGKIMFTDKETYTTSDSRQLSIKQRKCVFPDEIKLDTDYYYTYSGCLAHCRLHYAKEKCNCIPHFHSKISGYKHCDLKGLACLSEFSRMLQQEAGQCRCTPACLNHIYELEKLEDDLSSDVGEDHLTIGFISWPMVRYKKEVLFGWIDLLVSFGGIGGLFLGFSLLSGVEFLYYFFLRSICMTYRNVEELQDLQTEYDKNEREILDIRLLPTHQQTVIKTKSGKILPLILKPKSYYQIHMEEKEMGINDSTRYQD